MGANLPQGRIDRGALERIIQRAAELQAGEREIGDGLTESELLKLGQEVGIPDRYLQQAMLEERTRSTAAPEGGVITWLVGPHRVATSRVVPGEAKRIQDSLDHWMTEGELLAVKRRFANQLSWEPQQGAFASLRRSLGLGGRRYVLARAREVSCQIQQVDAGTAHVALVADLSNSRGEYLGGAAFLTLGGATVTAIGIPLGVAPVVAVLPAILGVVSATFAARSRLKQVDRFQVALEQVLDRLEHGELDASRTGSKIESPLARIATEIKRGLNA